MVGGDAVAITAALVIGHVLRFGLTDPDVTGIGAIPLSYVPLSLAILIVWIPLLGVYQAYDHGVLGSGGEEYARSTRASFALFGGMAVISYLLRIDISRGYFVVILPVGTGLLLLWRWLARRLLVRERRAGHLVHRAILLGGSGAVARKLVAEIDKRPELGIDVVGACLRDRSIDAFIPGSQISVLGGIDDALDAMRLQQADTLLVTGTAGLSSEKIRQLSWALDPESQHLLLAPPLLDIAGPRTQLRPIDGVPLIQVDIPRFSGGKFIAKRATDIAAALFLIVLLIPLWLIVPLLIWREDHAPALFRQCRVGLGGRTFTMYKFRSMRPDAEQLLAKLKAEHDSSTVGNEVLFKLRDDPRVTRVGRVLRKFSVDELPQLFNVLRGDMSLVGPRPPLEREVEQYEAQVRRRFLVKPGITGMWQVNGRSRLSWEESVRLDLYYVENWSLVGDLRILFRTVKVVLHRDGAY
nr:sugar transferase [Brooklawnia cerclae]